MIGDLHVGMVLYCFIDLEGSEYENSDMIVCSKVKIVDIYEREQKKGDDNIVMMVETLETTDNNCPLSRVGCKRAVSIAPATKTISAVIPQVVNDNYEAWRSAIKEYTYRKKLYFDTKRDLFEKNVNKHILHISV